jgi:hypothetical protein
MLSGHCHRKSDPPSPTDVTPNGTLDPKEVAMAKAVTTPVSPPITIPVREFFPWLLFAVLLLLMIYFVGAEEAPLRLSPACMCTNSA